MNRDLRIDSLKGFLIILVIIGHTSLNSFNIEKQQIFSSFTQWIYFFHMPLFFAISVLFIKNDFIWIAKRASLILTPYFFWFFYGHKKLLLENPLGFMGGGFMGNWESLNSIIWFLPALFALNVAMYIFTLAFIVQKIYQNKTKLVNIKYMYIVLAICISSYVIFEFEPLKTHTQYHSIIDLAQFSVATTFIGYLSFLLLNSSLFVLFLKIKSIKTFENSGAKISFLILTIGFSLVLPMVVSKSLMKISDKFKYIGMTK